MSFEVRKATRQGITPLIGLYAESGCGKTYSALLMARGLVGDSGNIVMIDTESGRGSLYADVIPGGYGVIGLTDPFTPARYIEAIQAAEKSGANVIIIDSASHSWEGIGGVLDMASEIEAKTGKPGLHCWKTPKLEHNKMLRRMLQSPVPIIVCLRAKHKSRQVKENGKTVIIKDDFTTPIQADDFIFEMTAHMEILQDHTIRLTKHSHPSLKECFPAKGPITIETGNKIAQWCASPGGNTTVGDKQDYIPSIDSVVESVSKVKGKDEFIIRAGGMEFFTTYREIAEAAKKSQEESLIASIEYNGKEIISMRLPDKEAA